MTCQSFIISGVLLCVGKRPHVLSFAQENFSGRKDIRFTQQLRRLWKKQKECSMCYADFCEKALSYACHQRQERPTSDKFAGAEATYAIEALMHDGKALAGRNIALLRGRFCPVLSIFSIQIRKTSLNILIRHHGA